MHRFVEDNDNNFMKILGAIVRAHRENLKKSMYIISAESSVSKSTWREIELGMCKDIRLKTLWKVSEGLNIPVTQILEELTEKLGSTFTLSDLD